MNGFIAVEVQGPDRIYEPRCACGWVGRDTSTVEWAELAFEEHQTTTHTEAIA